jgi:putative tryptophan/tyrosine transport system substrate-binding protein
MRFNYLRRREFIALVGGAAAAWPRQLVAQPAERVYRIGVLFPFPASVLAAWFDELRRLGFVEGQNLAVDRRGFASSYEQFPTIAAELVKAGLDAMICGGDAAIRAAQAATATIPIVAATDDMVGAGLAQSLAHPGGNTTGISLLASELDGKRQDILFDLLPAARHMAMLADSQTTGGLQLQAIRDAARSRGVELSIHEVQRSEEIASAVEAAKASGAAGLNVLASPLLHGNRHTIIERTARLRLPAIYQWPETVEEGGLLGYGPRWSEFMRLWARLAAKVLRGAKPADVPIEQPTRFELVINLQTAKAIGIDVSAVLVLRADKVIE